MLAWRPHPVHTSKCPSFGYLNSKTTCPLLLNSWTDDLLRDKCSIHKARIVRTPVDRQDHRITTIPLDQQQHHSSITIMRAVKHQSTKNVTTHHKEADHCKHTTKVIKDATQRKAKEKSVGKEEERSNIFINTTPTTPTLIHSNVCHPLPK